MSLNTFPVSSQNGFLKASKLGFRIVRGKTGFYQEIRFISSVDMHGFLGFNTDPAIPTYDDKIYNKLHARVSVSNFPNSSFMDFTHTITPGAGQGGFFGASDVLTYTFFPSEAQHLANLALVGTDTATVKTATSMTNTLSGLGALNGTQQFDLSNLLVDPDGGGKSIRAWQHLMMNQLAVLRPAVEAQQSMDIANGLYTIEDIWDRIWTIVDDGTHFGDADAIVKNYSGGLISDNPPTGNLPPIGGRILQIQKSVNAANDPIFFDLLGVEGSHYYPGVNVQQRSQLWAPSSYVDITRPSTALPSYHAPDLIYTTQETLGCSETRHRIHQSPVLVILDNRTILILGGGYFGGFGPDTYDNGAASNTSLSPVDEFGRVQFDTLCPANVIVGFFGDPANPDKFWVSQIFERDPTTTVPGFTIPP